MARTQTAPGTAPSAALAAPDDAPAPVAAPAADSPATAVHAALAANPGSTVPVIADAAGTGKPAAREALLAMEKDGTATRVKGGKPGHPDTWTLAEATQPDAGPADAGPADAGPEDEQDGQPGDVAASSPDGPGGEAPGEAGQDEAAETTGPADAEAGTGAEAGDGTSTATGPETETRDLSGNAPADAEDPADGQDDEAVPVDPQDPGNGDAPRDDTTPEDGGSEASDAPDPALVTEIADRIAQIRAAADAAAVVVTGGANLRAALAGLDEIAEQATQARRTLKAAIGGRKTPATRPGGLRDNVLAHLQANPGTEFTPHQIHNALGNSSGAIANALDVLVKRGEAELSCEKPRRFRLVGSTPDAGTAATDAAVTDEPGDGDRADDGTPMAGAA